MDLTLYIGDDYEEKGASIPDGWVLYISGSVDTSTAGVYEIEYYALNPETGQNVTRIKTVEVVQPGITLSGDSVITVSLPDIASYVDAGATSSDGTVLVTNLDGTVSESFTGLPNIAGSYTLIYYTPGSFSNFVTRTIHVSDPNSGGGGGGGDGEEIPSNGPTGVDLSIPIPTTGPENAGYTILISNGPTGVELTIPAPTTGPENTTIEQIPVKPAAGYPIELVFDPNAVAVPNVGFPIENIEVNTSDPTIPVTPNTGYPIENIEVSTTDPTIPVTPNTGYPIENIEVNTSDPTIPITPSTGYPIENIE